MSHTIINSAVKSAKKSTKELTKESINYFNAKNEFLKSPDLINLDIQTTPKDLYFEQLVNLKRISDVLKRNLYLVHNSQEEEFSFNVWKLYKSKVKQLKAVL